MKEVAFWLSTARQPVTEGSRCLQRLEQPLSAGCWFRSPSTAAHKGSRARAHIATALTADWTRGVLGPLAGSTTASCLLGSAALLSLLLLPTRLWRGHLKARRSRAAKTGCSSTSPTVCASGCFYTETCGRQTLQPVLHRKLRTKRVLGGIDLLLRVSSKSGSTKWNPPWNHRDTNIYNEKKASTSVYLGLGTAFP